MTRIDDDFDTMRELLKVEAAKVPDDEVSQKMTGLILIGLSLLQAAFTDLHRVADALEIMSHDETAMRRTVRDRIAAERIALSPGNASKPSWMDPG